MYWLRSAKLLGASCADCKGTGTCSSRTTPMFNVPLWQLTQHAAVGWVSA